MSRCPGECDSKRENGIGGSSSESLLFEPRHESTPNSSKIYPDCCQSRPNLCSLDTSSPTVTEKFCTPGTCRITKNCMSSTSPYCSKRSKDTCKCCNGSCIENDNKASEEDFSHIEDDPCLPTCVNQSKKLPSEHKPQQSPPFCVVKQKINQSSTFNQAQVNTNFQSSRKKMPQDKPSRANSTCACESQSSQDTEPEPSIQDSLSPCCASKQRISQPSAFNQASSNKNFQSSRKNMSQDMSSRETPTCAPTCGSQSFLNMEVKPPAQESLPPCCVAKKRISQSSAFNEAPSNTTFPSSHRNKSQDTLTCAPTCASQSSLNMEPEPSIQESLLPCCAAKQRISQPPASKQAPSKKTFQRSRKNKSQDKLSSRGNPTCAPTCGSQSSLNIEPPVEQCLPPCVANQRLSQSTASNQTPTNTAFQSSRRNMSQDNSTCLPTCGSQLKSHRSQDMLVNRRTSTQNTKGCGLSSCSKVVCGKGLTEKMDTLDESSLNQNMGIQTTMVYEPACQKSCSVSTDSKKPQKAEESVSSKCVSKCCRGKSQTECQCRYPPNFKQFSCTANLAGNCECSQKNC